MTRFKLDLRPFTVRPTTLNFLVLDASASMAKHGNAPEVAINRHLDNLRSDLSVAHAACLVTFGEDARIEIPLAVISQVPSYTGYSADGTATMLWRTTKRLIEAVCDAWAELTPAEQASLKIIFGVMSDGQDNRSNHGRAKPQYPEALVEYSALARRRNWDLLAFGIGIDGKRLAREMGFDENLATTVDATVDGIHQATDGFSEHTRRAGDEHTRRAGQSTP